MKIITIAAVSCALFCSTAFAQETKPTGLYLKGFYGHAINKSYSPSVLGAGLGYKFGMLRAEGQYGYGKNSYAHKHQFNAMGYLDLDNKTILSPYIGLGFGSSNYTMPINNYSFKNSYHYRAPIATVGTRVYLNENVAVDVGYKSFLNSYTDKNATLGVVYHF